MGLGDRLPYQKVAKIGVLSLTNNNIKIKTSEELHVQLVKSRGSFES